MLSGIKPSGDLTPGQLSGAIRNWAERAEEYDCFYFLADLHTITVRQNPADLRRRTMEQLAQYIACGLDPRRTPCLFSAHVHQHAELGWVLDCYTMFGELSRMTQFKDKCAKNADNINGGLLPTRPLMAADILLYQPDLVLWARTRSSTWSCAIPLPAGSTAFTATCSSCRSPSCPRSAPAS